MNIRKSSMKNRRSHCLSSLLGEWDGLARCWSERGVKRVLILLEEFLGSREFHFRKPRVFFSGISLPLDKVLPLG